MGIKPSLIPSCFLSILFQFMSLKLVIHIGASHCLCLVVRPPGPQLQEHLAWFGLEFLLNDQNARHIETAFLNKPSGIV